MGRSRRTAPGVEAASLLWETAAGHFAPEVEPGLFVNAASLPGLPRHLVCQTHWRETYLQLRAAGLPVSPDYPADRFRFVLCHLPRNMAEARIVLAEAAARAGCLLVAASNDAGGKRIPGLLDEAGAEYEKTTKSRCTLCRVDHPQPLAKPAAPLGLVKGSHGFFSMPGIFGWDQVDAGSRLLAEHLPPDLSGTGADFGCGYGYLTRAVLDRCGKATRFYAVDADSRAVDACRRNNGGEGLLSVHWLDLTLERLPEKLDFIVMNPPFHAGKNPDFDLGRAMIGAAAGSLRASGELWMVANRHLPYEGCLEASFKRVLPVLESNGYKVLRAVK